MNRLSQTLRIGMALIVASFSTNLLPVAVAYADRPITPGGNEACPDGTTELAKYNWSGNSYVAETGSTNVAVSGTAELGSFTVLKANTTVSAVVVKGSNNAKITDYANVTSGTFNNSTLVNNGGQVANISNVKICGTTTVPAPTQVSANVTFDDQCGTTNDTFTLDQKTGVTYTVNGNSNQAVGAQVATGTVNVVASASSASYTLSGQANFSATFTNTPCVHPQTPVNPTAPTFNDVCGTVNDTVILPQSTSEITYSKNGNVVTATLVNPTTNDFGPSLNGYVVAQDGLTATYTVTYQFTNAPCLTPSVCAAPSNGGVITQNTEGWTSKDVKFVNNGVVLSSNNWSSSYLYNTDSFKISDALQLGWTTEGTVSGANGVAIIFKTQSGAFVHYEPAPYSNDFWTNTPGILPVSGVGQGGAYSGSLQDILDTAGDITVVSTYFYFNSSTANTIVLKSLSFNCMTYTFDEEEKVVVCPMNTEWSDVNKNGKVDDGECFKKVFVCKYVGTPGFNERLQTGNNPISVSVNSIKDFQGVGSYFNDAQGRSFVLAFDEGQAEPDVSNCPNSAMQPCTVTNNFYTTDWMFDGDSFPASNDATNYRFTTNGLELNTQTQDDYVYGFIDGGKTKLSAVDTMTYETYRKAVSAGYEGTLPAYILLVDTNGSATSGGNKYFFYEPYYNGTVLENTWQTWDAINGGNAKWYVSSTGQTLRSWSYLVANYPDAEVLAYGFNQGQSNAETYTVIQDIQFDCATTHFSAPQVLGEETTDPTPVTPTVVVPTVAAVLPVQIAATGANDDQSSVLLLTGIVLGAMTYFFVLRRQKSYEL